MVSGSVLVGSPVVPLLSPVVRVVVMPVGAVVVVLVAESWGAAARQAEQTMCRGRSYR